jgi:hypothetical protein
MNFFVIYSRKIVKDLLFRSQRLTLRLKLKNQDIKKFFGMLAIAVALVACNDDAAAEKAAADSTRMADSIKAADSAAAAAAAMTPPVVDTTMKMDSTMMKDSAK